MRRLLLILCAATPFFLTACGGHAFHDLTYREALAKAKAEKKAVMIDFSTSWCGPCQKLERETFSNSEVQAFLNRNTVAIQIDGDAKPDMVEQFGVTGYPTIVFLNSDGSEVGRFVGFRPPQLFLAEARQYFNGS